MATCKELCSKLWNDEDAATMVEYALMLALISAVCISAITQVGLNASKMFVQVAGTLD